MNDRKGRGADAIEIEIEIDQIDRSVDSEACMTVSRNLLKWLAAQSAQTTRPVKSAASLGTLHLTSPHTSRVGGGVSRLERYGRTGDGAFRTIITGSTNCREQ